MWAPNRGGALRGGAGAAGHRRPDTSLTDVRGSYGAESTLATPGRARRVQSWGGGGGGLPVEPRYWTVPVPPTLKDQVKRFMQPAGQSPKPML
jgi:hypothetical protein